MENKRTIIKIAIYLTVLLLVAVGSSPFRPVPYLWLGGAGGTVGNGNTKIDSLKTVIQTAGRDTKKVKALSDLAWELMYSNPDTATILCEQVLELLGSDNLQGKGDDDNSLPGYPSLHAAVFHTLGAVNYIQSNYPQALEYYFKALKIKEQLLGQAKRSGNPDEIGKYKKDMANSYNNIGAVYWNQSSYPQALEYYFKSLKIRKELGDKKGIAGSYNNIGIIYWNQSSYPQALKYYFKSLKIEKQLGNKQGMADSYNNIGVIYENQSSYPQALEYYFESIKIKRELNDTLNTYFANTYNNIGLIYANQSSYPQALGYYFKALKIYKELGDKKGVAMSYTNIGSLYTVLYTRGDSPDTLGYGVNLKGAVGWIAQNPALLLDTALHYQQQALLINKELSDEYQMTFSLSGIGSIYFLKKDYPTVIQYYQQAVLLADDIGALQQGSEAHSGLAECYEQTGSYKLALEHYKQYTTLKDTVFNEEKSKEIGKLEARHEMEMAEMKRKQEEEEQARILEEQTQRRHLLQYSGIFIFIIAIFAILLFSGQLNIPVRVAKSGVFFTFLLVYEFVLVLIDPYIEQWITEFSGQAGGEPAYNLIVNIALAGLFLPLHNFAVSKLEQRLFKTRKRKLEKIK
ncbi:MAG: tetratricopeptide repeat protein [Cytophagales bacterium]|nr:tetratricopeptide repeat protein [Cytophagales bacterium]